MAGSSGNQEDSISGINVTPLVDITLVLLIIFIATSATLVKAELGINLPKQAAPAEETTPPLILVIKIDAQSKIDINGKDVPRGELKEFFEKAKKQDARVSAQISPDSKTKYNTVVQVVDAVREAQIKQFALAVIPRAEAEGEGK